MSDGEQEAGKDPGLSSDALRSRGGREAPCSGQHCPLPAAAASPRSVPAGGAAPAYRPHIAVRRYPAGIKARLERPQTGRAVLARSEPKTERRRAVPVPSEQQGSGRPGGGYLSLRLSLIPTRAPSRPPVCQCLTLPCLAPSARSVPNPRSAAYKGHEEAANSFPAQTARPQPHTVPAATGPAPPSRRVRGGRLIHDMGSTRSLHVTIFFFSYRYFFFPPQCKTLRFPPPSPSPLPYGGRPLPCEAGEGWRLRLSPCLRKSLRPRGRGRGPSRGGSYCEGAGGGFIS